MPTDIAITCQICKRWKASGTIETDQDNIIPDVMDFVRREIAKHPEHGQGGKWQINYSPR